MLIWSVVFSLFPSFIGRLSFFCPLHCFLSQTTQMLLSPGSLSHQFSFTLSKQARWAGRRMEFSSNIRSSWMVWKYSAICSSQFSCQVFLVSCLDLLSENKVHLFGVSLLGNWKLSGVQLIVTESALMHKKIVVEWKVAQNPIASLFPQNKFGWNSWIKLLFG